MFSLNSKFSKQHNSESRLTLYKLEEKISKLCNIDTQPHQTKFRIQSTSNWLAIRSAQEI